MEVRSEYLGIFLNFMCMGILSGSICLSIYLSIYITCKPGGQEVRGGHWIPWDWSCEGCELHCAGARDGIQVLQKNNKCSNC